MSSADFFICLFHSFAFPRYMFLNPHHYTLQLHEEIFFHSHTYFNRHIVGIFEIVKGQKVYLSSRPDLFHHAISPISGHKIRAAAYITYNQARES